MSQFVVIVKGWGQAQGRSMVVGPFRTEHKAESAAISLEKNLAGASTSIEELTGVRSARETWGQWL